MRGRPSPPLPAELARTITWDQGMEMACHTDFTIATGNPVHFCDPHRPWVPKVMIACDQAS